MVITHFRPIQKGGRRSTLKRLNSDDSAADCSYVQLTCPRVLMSRTTGIGQERQPQVANCHLSSCVFITFNTVLLLYVIHETKRISQFLANVNSSSCSLYVIDGPSVCLSSVCNVGAPYSGD